MALSKRAKACDIPKAVKDTVWERDEGCCIICGSPHAMPNAHFVARAHGGLGIPENIVTLCMEHHRAYDQSTQKAVLREHIRSWLKSKYPGWEEANLIYKK